MDTHDDVERRAAAADDYDPVLFVRCPTDPEAWVNAGLAEDIKDDLAEVVLAGFRGAPPNETYRMTAATLADVCVRVLARMLAHPPDAPTVDSEGGDFDG